MTKKRASLILAGLLTGSLVAAACSATDSTIDGTATPAPETTAELAPAATTYTPPTATYTTPAPAPSSSREDLFIRVLDSKGFPHSDEQVVIDTGLEVCATLDRGTPVAAVAGVLMSELEPELAGTLLGAAVYTLCPGNVPAVEEFMADFGGGR